MTQKNLILLATVISFGLMILALGFQHIGGLQPCQLCLWQRWPHWIMVGIGVFALLIGGRLWAALGALTATTSLGLAIFHTGVERKWWEGLKTCSGGGDGVDINDTANLLNFSEGTLPVACDQIVWDTWGLGVTMTNWNVLISLCLIALWIMVFRRAD